ncbi:hypothetical protein BpHYR1_044260 [Brachionus plicatilis]|uniref:Uncharacterized protein n=1 Tax=Brachionus plicatilis TaxID=10195 RepID=A0A3M7SV92_BRAPC|nr:hypothetical protein BpHYR1_044260 [Brachionus plicatilis]
MALMLIENGMFKEKKIQLKSDFFGVIFVTRKILHSPNDFKGHAFYRNSHVTHLGQSFDNATYGHLDLKMIKFNI